MLFTQRGQTNVIKVYEDDIEFKIEQTNSTEHRKVNKKTQFLKKQVEYPDLNESALSKKCKKYISGVSLKASAGLVLMSKRFGGVPVYN